MNELQRKYQNWEANIKKTYPPVINLLLEKLDGMEDLTGAKLNTAISDAVDETYSETLFLDTIENRTVSATMGASQIGLGSQLSLNLQLADPYYRATQFANGINLHGSVWNGDSQKVVKKVVSDYMAFAGNTQALSKKIGSAATSKAKLPQYLDDLIKLSKTTNQKAIEMQLKKAKREIAKLTTEGYTRDQLKASYSRVVKAVEKASSPQALAKVVENAFNHKVNYINSRVARTEMARAYGMSFYRRVEEDKGIIGVRWTLSSGHVPDICDFYADSDSYGHGAGFYPRYDLPPFPAHPSCLCALIAIRADPDNPIKNARFSEERSIDYLNSVSQEKRNRILGKVNVPKEDWVKRLRKQGFKSGTTPPMTAKKVIEELR